MNADYYRSHGYIVREREYGTRVYSEMFTVEDKHGNAFVEVRRHPQSGESSFTGLSEFSCHLRLTNRACYSNTAVRDLADFMVMHGYIFQRIFRIDICYDFLRFDSGDHPEKFLRRYIEKKFSKMNQTKVVVYGDESWGAFAWESVSWGSPTSMVSTKMYNKTKELAKQKYKKNYIVQAWFASGLIDDPLNLPDVWRVEFSMKSTAMNWLVIEDIDGKKHKKKAIPHRMELFDGRDRLWQRFEDLAHHYFQFRFVEYLEKQDKDGEPMLRRKYECKEKKLFSYNSDRTFYSIEGVARECIPDNKLRRLRVLLSKYRENCCDMKVREAIDVLLDRVNRSLLNEITVHGYAHEIDVIRLAIATRTGWNYQTVIEKAEEIHKLIEEGEIW